MRKIGECDYRLRSSFREKSGVDTQFEACVRNVPLLALSNHPKCGESLLPPVEKRLPPMHSETCVRKITQSNTCDVFISTDISTDAGEDKIVHNDDGHCENTYIGIAEVKLPLVLSIGTETSRLHTCSGALVLLCLMRTLDHASMISAALAACATSPVAWYLHTTGRNKRECVY